MENDSKTRKWFITQNNPESHGFTREYIREVLASYDSVIYWCMADEIGNECGTPHTHIFLHTTNAVRFSTMKKKFPKARLDMAKGTSQECKDYIFKEGKYKNDKKAGTHLPETREEYGQMQIERPGQRNDMSDMQAMVEEGMTALEIVKQIPSLTSQMEKIMMYRQAYLKDKYGDIWRDVEVTYIYGDTGTGKTRGVMEKYGYKKVCRVTGYVHPFDNYDGHEVLLLDEYRSNFRIGDLLTYLEGYPEPHLPARYSAKVPMYTKVYIISNIPLHKQYPNIQRDEIKTWEALKRRINKVLEYKEGGIIEERTVDQEIWWEGK